MKLGHTVRDIYPEDLTTSVNIVVCGPNVQLRNQVFDKLLRHNLHEPTQSQQQLAQIQEAKEYIVPILVNAGEYKNQDEYRKYHKLVSSSLDPFLPIVDLVNLVEEYSEAYSTYSISEIVPFLKTTTRNPTAKMRLFANLTSDTECHLFTELVMLGPPEKQLVVNMPDLEDIPLLSRPYVDGFIVCSNDDHDKLTSKLHYYHLKSALQSPWYKVLFLTGDTVMHAFLQKEYAYFIKVKGKQKLCKLILEDSQDDKRT